MHTSSPEHEKEVQLLTGIWHMKELFNCFLKLDLIDYDMYDFYNIQCMRRTQHVVQVQNDRLRSDYEREVAANNAKLSVRS